MSLIFDSKEHKYYLNNKELISTTTLLAKHGLAVDYSQVNPQILARAAQFGSEKHKELELYFKGQITKDDLYGSIVLKGIELLEQNNITPYQSELRVHNGEVAGTIDLIGFQDDEVVLVDFKFTSVLNNNAVMWQTNVYRELTFANYQMEITKLYCLWFNQEKQDFELRLLPNLDKEVVEELFEKERNGENYSEVRGVALKDVSRQLALNEKLVQLANAELIVKEIKNEVDILKDELAVEMEKAGINSIDLKDFRIAYVRPTVSKRVDYKKLVDDMGIDTSGYVVKSERKGYVRITEIGKMSKAEVIDSIKERDITHRFKKKVGS